MSRVIISAGACTVAVAAALTFAGTAGADPADPMPAPDDTAGASADAAAQIAKMQAEGKAVHILGAKTAPMQDCSITGTSPEKNSNSVMVRISCPVTDY